jgi:hypothetical protein
MRSKWFLQAFIVFTWKFFHLSGYLLAPRLFSLESVPKTLRKQRLFLQTAQEDFHQDFDYDQENSHEKEIRYPETISKRSHVFIPTAGINALINKQLSGVETAATEGKVDDLLHNLRGLNFGVRGFSNPELTRRLLSALQTVKDLPMMPEQIAGILRNAVSFIYTDRRPRENDLVINLMGKYLAASDQSPQSLIMFLTSVKYMQFSNWDYYLNNIRPSIVRLLNDQLPILPTLEMRVLIELVSALPALKIHWSDFTDASKSVFLKQLSALDFQNGSKNAVETHEKIIEGLGEIGVSWNNDITDDKLKRDILAMFENNLSSAISLNVILHFLSGLAKMIFHWKQFSSSTQQKLINYLRHNFQSIRVWELSLFFSSTLLLELPWHFNHDLKTVVFSMILYHFREEEKKRNVADHVIYPLKKKPSEFLSILTVKTIVSLGNRLIPWRSLPRDLQLELLEKIVLISAYFNANDVMDIIQG